MKKQKVMVWESLATVSGGQKMTLKIMDMLSDYCEFCCLIPSEGLLSIELKKRGIQYILMGDQSLPTGVKGKKIIFLYAWMSIKNILKSLRAIYKFSPNALYAPGPAALPWSSICGFLTCKPVIWHLHHIFIDGATVKLLNLCSCLPSVRKILAVSDCVGKQITSNSSCDKISVLYNPVDFEKYSSGNRECISGEIEEKLSKNIFGSDGKNIIVGHIGLVQSTKRQAFVLDVAMELLSQGYNVTFLFAGELRDEKYFSELKNKVKEYNLFNSVLFLGRRNDIPDVLKLLDVLIIPSQEGFPLVGLEAASAGVPVVACDTAGAKEFINVSGSGYTFRENDVKSAALSIVNAIKDKQNLADSGKKFAKESTEDLYAIKLKKILDSL